jgi:hypothetical protein
MVHRYNRQGNDWTGRLRGLVRDGMRAAIGAED